MIPSVLSTQIKEATNNFLRTSFPCSTSVFEHAVEDLIERGEAFQGPFLSLQLPFSKGQSDGVTPFPEIPLSFSPHRHQERAFERLRGENPKPTIIATGTGSGKTEAFLIPILDYCRRHAGKPGIKAILIYPMNALATDQAQRIARLIYHTQSLRGKIRAGLYIGGKGVNQQGKMSATGVITSRTVMQMHPPDILLTNYKMLDYLMVRPRDAQIWQGNTQETLRFLVVDELHTFDGAQGTDLACLVRRLKARVQSSEVCPIGTSATLGTGNNVIPALTEYAQRIFDTNFDEDAIITEERETPGQFLESVLVDSFDVPTDISASGLLNPSRFRSMEGYVNEQFRQWLGVSDIQIQLADKEWQSEMGKRIKGHVLVQNLIKIAGLKTTPHKVIAHRLAETNGQLKNASPETQLRVLDSLLTIISATSLLHVHVQLWMREWRRMVASVSSRSQLVWADDTSEASTQQYLPLVLCRHCGTAAWGGRKQPHDECIIPYIHPFYQSFFAGNTDLCLLFPDPKDEWREDKRGKTSNLCPTCLHLNNSNLNACNNCNCKELIRVFMPDLQHMKDGKIFSRPYCPSCESRYDLSLVGAQTVSLASVFIGQLFTSPYNDHKKILAFSDSIQDASHRAGFFQARTFQFTLRSELANYLHSRGEEETLQEVADGFVKHHRETNSDDDFVGRFIPPDLAWRYEYEELCKNGRLPRDTEIPKLIQQRLNWEIFSTYGLRARIGRSLEKSLVSVAAPHPDLFSRACKDLWVMLRAEIGGLQSLSEQSVKYFLSGLLYRLRVMGAIYHPALKSYVAHMGKYYHMSHRMVPYMPPLGNHARTPAFLTTGRSDRFKRLFRTGQNTWFSNWAIKCIDLPLYKISVLEYAMTALENRGLVKKREMSRNTNVWGIPGSALHITTDVQGYRCSQCNHTISAPSQETHLWKQAPCQRYMCSGTYQNMADTKPDYYHELYQSGDLQRIVAAEHTGLLQRQDREILERRFKEGNRPWEPNLISCTPTLELGIDIGDLSSLILCSVPPAQSNYLQRIGRAGRRDNNALSLTIATSQAHDLYFFSNPKEMIAGDVEPPGMFLDAPAVLERQLTAYCMDRWIASGIPFEAVPPVLGKIFDNLVDLPDTKRFPHNWLHFIDKNIPSLLTGFFDLFVNDSLSKESKTHLQNYLENELRHRLLSSLNQKKKERNALKNKMRAVRKELEALDKIPKDKIYDTNRSDLLRDRRALRGLVRDINNTNTYNFLTGANLLPNFAFPEPGITLKSVLCHKENDDWTTNTKSYERGGATAIREFAPGNTFYAEGHKVTIDQIDLALSGEEKWRFCTECAYSEREVKANQSACPMCNSTSWADIGNKHAMIHAQQFYATSDKQASRSYDETEERKRIRFDQRMLVQYSPNDAKSAFALEESATPYGFEYYPTVTLREINFGRSDRQNETIVIAGKEVSGQGFYYCPKCGKVGQRDEIKHTFYCPNRTKKDVPVSHRIYLYREFSSEAIRMLLPFTSANSSQKEIDSFVAGLYLGLKKQYRGRIDHFRVTVQAEPIKGTHYRRNYLFVYDTVPGGTGYLKNLMRNPTAIMDVFQHAVETIQACSCMQDVTKDGCYRCLYAYRNSWHRNNVSRKTALDIFSHILSLRDSLACITHLGHVDMVPLLESELEKRFIVALEKHVLEQKVGGYFHPDTVRGKSGYSFSLGERRYQIEPQVSLGEEEGVHIPSRADFVIRPTFDDAYPIVVFTDGYAHHKNRLDEDSAQRMALLKTGKYLVWSLSWNDVEGTPDYNDYIPLDSSRPTSQHFREIVNHMDKASGVQSVACRTDGEKSNLDWLYEYLANPSYKAWQALAYIHAVINMGNDETHSSWNQKFKEKAPDFVAEAYPEGSDDVVGHYSKKEEDGPSGNVAVLTRTSRQGLESYDVSSMHCLVHLNDTEDARAQPDFPKAWAGFLRVMNLFQFLPNAFFSTRSGLDKNAYDPLDVGDPDIGPGWEHEWETALQLSEEKCQDLLITLMQAGCPAPVVGFELADSSEVVLAQAELGWEKERVAVLLYDEGDQSLFEAAGWTVFSFPTVTADEIQRSLETP